MLVEILPTLYINKRLMKRIYFINGKISLNNVH